MKRARSEKAPNRLQRIVSCHESPQEYAAFIREYIQEIPDDRDPLYKLSFKLGLNLRSFVGFMPGETVRAQAEVLCKQPGPYRYFIYFSGRKPGKLTLCLTVKTEWHNRRSFRYCADTFEELQNEFNNHVESTGQRPIPIDRGECIMFAAHVNAQAKEAIVQWCLCAKQLGVTKDIRQYIGQMLWSVKYLWMP